MHYRVIEGGYWRHGTLHIESDSLIESYSFEDGTGKTEYIHMALREFTSDATGLDLYREMTDWLIKNNENGAYRSTFSARTAWPEFFGVYTRKDEIIDIMVNEEGSMWFVPESHEFFDAKAPEEGAMSSWLHSDIEEDQEGCIWFEELYPDGYIVPGVLIPANLSGRQSEDE